MNRSTREKLSQRKLEKFVLIPNGGRAARCQATTRAGGQCAKPARDGFSVCSSHGAGTAAREANKSRKRPGRPPSHGLYAKTTARELEKLQVEIREARIDFFDAEQEMVLARAALRWLVGRQDFMQDKTELLESVCVRLEEGVQALGQQLSEDPMHPTLEKTMRLTVKAISNIPGLQNTLFGWSDRIGEGVTRISKLQLDNASTRVKLSEARVQEEFMGLLGSLRPIIHDMLGSVERIDTFEERVRREILEKAGFQNKPSDEPN
jgi:hypothetical protein